MFHGYWQDMTHDVASTLPSQDCWQWRGMTRNMDTDTDTPWSMIHVSDKSSNKGDTTQVARRFERPQEIRTCENTKTMNTWLPSEDCLLQDVWMKTMNTWRSSQSCLPVDGVSRDSSSSWSSRTRLGSPRLGGGGKRGWGQTWKTLGAVVFTIVYYINSIGFQTIY